MLLFFSSAVVRFGFNPVSYSEAESVGSVNLGVAFLEGSFGNAPISVQLSLNTASGTAQGEHIMHEHVPACRIPLVVDSNIFSRDVQVEDNDIHGCLSPS